MKSVAEERPRAKRLRQAVSIVALVLAVLVALLVLEASGGHDGWLCEWGIDTDGAGTTTTGCG